MQPCSWNLWLAVVTITSWLGGGVGLAAEPADRSDPQVDNIEAQPLSALLGLDLADTLGTTDSVSRRTESVLAVPATLTRLEGVDIRRSGATSIPDLLRLVPGVQVVQSGPGVYTVSLRGAGGLAGNNVVVMIDGVRVNSPLDGNVDWDLIAIDPADVERIEVVRGPVGSVYGANAYTGVIDIVTRHTLGITPGYAARIQGGAATDTGATAGLSGRLQHSGDRVEYGVFVSAQHDSTFATPADDKDGRLPALNRVGGGAQLAASIGHRGQFRAVAGSSMSQRADFDHLSLVPTAQVRSLSYARAQLEWSEMPGLVDTLGTWSQVSLHQISDAPQDSELGFNYGGTRALTHGAGVDVAGNLVGLAVTAGGNVSVDQVRAPYIHPNENGKTRFGYGFYGSVGASPLESLDLAASIRGDLPTVNGRLAFSYRVSSVFHAEGWSVRASVGSAFRAPTTIEVGGRFVDPTTGLILLEGSPDLASPTNDAIEIGGIFSPSSTLTVSPTLYASRYSGGVAEDFEPLVRKTFRTVEGSADLIGAELEVVWKYRDGLHLRGAASFPYWIDGPESEGRQLTPIAGVSSQNSIAIVDVRATGGFLVDRIGYGVGVRVVSGRTYAVRAGIPPVLIRTKVPAATQVDGMLEFRVRRGGRWWTSLRIQSNLPRNLVESPLPGAGVLGTRALVGLEMRGD